MSYATQIQQGIPVGFFGETTAEKGKAQLGDEIIISPNLGFRYLKNGGTQLSAYRIVQASMKAVHDENIPAAAASGARKITVAAASVSKDDYKGGMLQVIGGSGEGQIFDITGNAATASNNVILNVHPAVNDALATDSDVIISNSIFRDVIVGTAGRNHAVGVTFKTVPANHYFWAIFYGVAGISMHAAITTADNDGTPLVKAADGKAKVQADTDIKQIIGNLHFTAQIAADDVVPVRLNLVA